MWRNSRARSATRPPRRGGRPEVPGPTEARRRRIRDGASEVTEGTEQHFNTEKRGHGVNGGLRTTPPGRPSAAHDGGSERPETSEPDRTMRLTCLRSFGAC